MAGYSGNMAEEKQSSIVSTPVNLVGGGTDIVVGTCSQDGTKAWMCSKNCVYVMNMEGDVIQRWKCAFGDIYYVEEVVYGLNQFLVVCTTSPETDSSVLVLLHASSLCAIKSFVLAEKVSSVCALSGFSSNGGSTFENILSLFDGVLAVGCYSGEVYVINLSINQGSLHSLSVRCFKAQEVTANDLTNPEYLVALKLVQDYVVNGRFFYQSSFPVSDFYVSALRYAPRISSLLIGYSFGSFIVWDMSSFEAVYSSPFSPQRSSPVVDFIYLEPENDPKYFVYVWVARGNQVKFQDTRSEHETKLTFYQLIYSQKRLCSVDVKYEGFQSCAPCMEYALTANPSTPNPHASTSTVFSRSFTTKCFKKLCDLNTSKDVFRNEEDLTVAVFVWFSQTASGHKCVVGVFDLNQWYHQQMPNTVRWKKFGKLGGVPRCPYFTFLSFDEVFDATQDLLDVSLKSFSPFPSFSPVPETHLWPSAARYSVTILRENSILTCSCLGVPRTALQQLRDSQFHNPVDVFDRCMQADLVNCLEDDLPDTRGKWFHFLEILIDRDFSAEVWKSFVNGWISAGNSHSLLLEWLCKKIDKIVGSLDIFSSQMSPLFLMKQLGAVQKLLDVVVLSFQQSDTKDLEKKYKDVLAWKKFVGIVACLLTNGVIDAVSSLSTSCTRTDSAIHQVCKEFSPSTVGYPPSSLKNIVKVFSGVNLDAVHSYILYLLHDLEGNGSVEPTCSLYAESLNLPPSLVQVTKMLWMMDKDMFKEPVHQTALLSLFPEKQIFDWQHQSVLSKLLEEDSTRTCLQYVCANKEEMCSLSDVKLKVAVFISSSRILKAYNIVNSYKNSQHHSELFYHFLTLCDQADELHAIFDLEYCKSEEVILEQYMKDSGHFDLLFLFYLRSYKFKEAVELHNVLDSGSLKQLMDEYVSSLFTGDVVGDGGKSFAPQSEAAEVLDSFSVTVGKAVKSGCLTTVNFHAGVLNNTLTSRYRPKFKPLVDSTSTSGAVSTPLEKLQHSHMSEKVHTPAKCKSFLPTARSACSAVSSISTPVCQFLSEVPHVPSPEEIPAIYTPDFEEMHQKRRYVSTPLSILKGRFKEKGHPHTKNIRFYQESPERHEANGSISKEDQVPIAADIFQSPVDSPSKLTSSSPAAGKLSSSNETTNTVHGSVPMEQSDINTTPGHSSEQLKQQSDVIRTPSYVFSPPLTRSAAKRVGKKVEPMSVSLAKPQPTTPVQTSATKRRTRQRKLVVDSANIGVRRSARLLQGGK